MGSEGVTLFYLFSHKKTKMKVPHKNCIAYLKAAKLYKVADTAPRLGLYIGDSIIAIWTIGKTRYEWKGTIISKISKQLHQFKHAGDSSSVQQYEVQYAPLPPHFNEGCNMNHVFLDKGRLIDVDDGSCIAWSKANDDDEDWCLHDSDDEDDEDSEDDYDDEVVEVSDESSDKSSDEEEEDEEEEVESNEDEFDSHSEAEEVSDPNYVSPATKKRWKEDRQAQYMTHPQVKALRLYCKVCTFINKKVTEHPLDAFSKDQQAVANDSERYCIDPSGAGHRTPAY
jgi:hypothetical protein